MIDFSKIEKVYVFSGPTDFRKRSFALLQLVGNYFSLDDIGNTLFVFTNKRVDSIRILQNTKTSIELYEKRLKQGKFTLPKVENNVVITPDELKIILTGLDFIRILEKSEKNYDYF